MNKLQEIQYCQSFYQLQLILDIPMKYNDASIFFYGFCLIILTGAASSCYQNNAAATVKNLPVKTIDSSNQKALLAINNAKHLLKDAALITRSDNDFESLTLQNFSKRDRSYSHSGIGFWEDSSYVIYHCMAGNENPNGACRRDLFDSFVNPSAKTGFGIFQYQLSATETAKLHDLVKKNFTSKIPFDVTFNLKSNDSLYCSEMIFKDLKAATNNRVVLPSSFIENFHPKIMGYKYNHAFFKRFEYIGLDDLYLNPFCKELTRVKY